MKKGFAWVLLLTMLLGLLSGCFNQNTTETTVPDAPISAADVEGINAAIDYLKAFYKDDGAETPVDFTRFGVVRISGVAFQVVWTVDVSEDLVKIVVNEDGTVTVDVNEQAQEETPYVLTATITDAVGNTASHSWNYTLPKAVDMIAIVEAAYALGVGEVMPYQSTLTGKVTTIKTPYAEDYKNITVIIEVAGAEDKPIECYRMKGEGVEEIAVGDTITVTGTLKNYNGTIEFDAGCICTKIIAGERVQAPDDMKQIVDAAYALGANKTLPYEAILTGEIIEIDSAYDPYYGNISVKFVVEGREDKPILAYRMKGDGVENLGVTDKITVQGYITNYVGDKGYSTIEYTAGCKLVKYEKGPGVYAPTDPVEIMKIVKALAPNAKTKFEATLTGKITKVNTAYDPAYDNITFTIEVEGTGDELKCYRIKGDGVSVLDIGDTATVKGYIVNYQHTSGDTELEFVAGSKLISYKKNPNVAPSDPVEILKAAYALEPGGQLPYKAKLTGKITEINTPYDPSFNNVTVTIVVDGAEDMPMKCYRMKGSGADAIKVGDTITVSGYIINYQHSSGDSEVEFTAGCTLDSWTAGSGSTDEPEVPPTVEAPETDVVVGTAYKFGMYQGTLKKNLYFTGKLGGKYLATSALASEAVDVYLEISGNGYNLYFMDGETKTYLTMEEYQDVHYKANVVLTTTEPTAKFTWSEELKTVVLNTGNETFCFGTYGTYDTLSCTSSFYFTGNNAASVDKTQFIARFYAADISDPEPTEPEATEPETPPVVDGPEADVVVGTAYKFGMYQGSLKKNLYFTGKLSGKYLGTSELASEAVDVYLEISGNGYNLYFMDGETKTYLTMEEYQDVHYKANVVLTTTEPTAKFTWSEELNTVVLNTGNETFCFGTYGTYDTLSCTSSFYFTGNNAASVDKTQFIARFYAADISDPEPSEPQPTEPEATEPSDVVTEPVMGTAYKFGMYQGSLKKTLYFTGKLSGKYLGMAEDASKAVDVFLEVSGNGYNFYFMDGETKTYLSMKERLDGSIYKADVVLTTTEPTAKFTWSEDLKTVVLNTGNETFCFGTYGTYDTLSCTSSYYVTGDNAANVDKTQFIGRFYVADVTDPEPSEPQPTEPQPTEPVTGNGYVQVTSAAQFTSGKYVMIVGTGYAPGVLDGTWITAVQPVVSGNIVTDTKDAVWTLTVNGDKVTITDATGATIKPKGGNNNGVANGAYEWVWEFNNGTFTFAGTGADTVKLASNATTDGQYPGNHRFRGYKTTTIASQSDNYPCDFTLYKLSDGASVPEVTEPTATEPQPTEPVTGETAEKLTAAPANGDEVVMYLSGNVMGFAASGKKLAAIAATVDGNTVAVTAEMAKLTVTVDGEYVIFSMDGKYLTSAETGNGLSFADTLTDYAKWVLEDAGNGAWYVKNATAAFSGKAQYIEFYTGFTTYGFNANNTAIYAVEFFKVGEGTIVPTEPQPTEPEATAPVTGEATVEVNPAAGTAYKFGMNQLGVNKTLYFTGKKDGKYLGMTEDVSKAVDVFLEVSGNGFNFYFMDGETKTYLSMEEYIPSGKNYYSANVVLSTTEPTAKFTWSEDLKTVVLNTGNEIFCYGTYGTYDTLSCTSSYYVTGDNAANVDKTQFIGRFYTVEATEPEVTEPEVTGPQTVTMTVTTEENVAPNGAVLAGNLVGISPEVFTVYLYNNNTTSETNYATIYQAGDDDYIRLGYHSSKEGASMAVNSVKEILSVKITYTKSSYGGGTILVDGTPVEGTVSEDGLSVTAQINANSFAVQNRKSSGQVRISSVEIEYNN